MALMWWWSNIKTATFLELVDKRLLTYKDISQKFTKIKMREEMAEIYTQQQNIHTYYDGQRHKESCEPVHRNEFIII